MDGQPVDVVWAILPKLVAEDDAVSDCMAAVVTLCNEQVPHEAWDQFRDIDYDADVERLQVWLAGAVRESHPAQPVRGLFFPLVHFGDEDSPFQTATFSALYTDIRLAGTGSYVPSDPELEWVNHQSYTPKHQYARSQALFQMSRILQSLSPSELSLPSSETDIATWRGANDLSIYMGWAVPLAFVVTTVRSLLKPHTNELLNAKQQTIGVACGWENGDLLEIGQLTEGGFVPIPASA